MTGRIKEKLDELVSLHGELLEDLPNQKVFISERIIRRGIEKTIQLIADTIIDIGLIIISKKGFSKPSDSRDTISILEKNKVLSKELSGNIQDLISFRNLLVHRYGKINQKEEYQNVSENHEDVINFVKEVEQFLKRNNQ